MSGLFDSLGALFAGGAGGSAAPAIGTPLIKALLAKHGQAMPDAGPGTPAPAAVADGPQVGSDVSSPEAQLSNVFDKMPTADMPAVMAPGGDSGIKDAFAANAAKPRGFLDRIGDFLHSDEGRATAMRFAAGAFDGGMAGGLKAATGFADERRHERAVTGAADADRAERGREFDATDAFRTGQLDLQRDQNGETIRHNKAGEDVDWGRIGNDRHNHDTASGDARLSSSTSILNHLNPSGDVVASQAGQNYRHDNASGDTITTQAAETGRNDADNRTALGVANINHQQPRNTVHVRYQATPGTLHSQHEAAVNAIRGATPEAQPGDAGAMVHHVANDAQYEALPSGTRFQGPDGQVRVKP